MPIKKCIESIAVYGASGTGKTTQGEELARLVRSLLGEDKVVRLASANADGWSVIQPAVDLGYIVPLWVPSRENLIQTIDRLTRGWWPLHPDDPKSPMLPPDKQADLAKVGGTIFDSGTDFADLIMRYALGREAQPGSTFKLAAESASHVYKDGDKGDETGYAASSKGMYGSDQNRMEQCMNQSKDIAGQFIMWTFLEDKGKDQVTKAAVYAPDVIGSAINGKVPSWFGRTVRLSMHLTDKGVVRRMWLKNHFQAGDPVPYLANVRDHWMAPLPTYLEGRDVSLFTLYTKLQESYKKATEIQLAAKKG